MSLNCTVLLDNLQFLFTVVKTLKLSGVILGECEDWAALMGVAVCFTVGMCFYSKQFQNGPAGTGSVYCQCQ